MPAHAGRRVSFADVDPPGHHDDEAQRGAPRPRPRTPPYAYDIAKRQLAAGGSLEHAATRADHELRQAASSDAWHPAPATEPHGHGRDAPPRETDAYGAPAADVPATVSATSAFERFVPSAVELAPALEPPAAGPLLGLQQAPTAAAAPTEPESPTSSPMELDPPPAAPEGEPARRLSRAWRPPSPARIAATARPDSPALRAALVAAHGHSAARVPAPPTQLQLGLQPAARTAARPASPVGRAPQPQQTQQLVQTAPAARPASPAVRAAAPELQSAGAPRPASPGARRLGLPEAAAAAAERPHAEAAVSGRPVPVRVAAWLEDGRAVFAVSLAVRPAPGPPRPPFERTLARRPRAQGTAYVAARRGAVEERPVAATAAEWRAVGPSSATADVVRQFAAVFRQTPVLLRRADGTPQSFAVRLLQHLGLGNSLAPLLELLERHPSSPRCPWRAEVRRAEADEDDEEAQAARRRAAAAAGQPLAAAAAAERAAAAQRRREAAVRLYAKEIGRELRAAAEAERARAADGPWRVRARTLFTETQSERIYSVRQEQDMSAGRARLAQLVGRLKQLYDDRARDLPRPEERDAIFAQSVPSLRSLLPDGERTLQEAEPRPKPPFGGFFGGCLGGSKPDRHRPASPAAVPRAPSPRRGASHLAGGGCLPAPPAVAPRPPSPAAGRPSSPASWWLSPHGYCSHAGARGAPPAAAF